MFSCITHINIESETQTLTLSSLLDFESEQTFKNLTNTAKLKLPRKLYFADGVKDLIKRGNHITIQVGYVDKTSERLHTRFAGYISYVTNEVPVVIDCEDEMYMLKQRSVKPKAWKKATLKDVLNYCGINDFTALGDYNLSKFNITNEQSNVAKVLELLDSSYGIKCFYRNNKLHAGNPYSSSRGKTKIFAIGKNIQQSDLKYRSKDEVKLKVTAISTSKDGKKIQVEVGDKEGEARTLNFYGLSKTDLEKQAKEKLEEMKYDGYSGSFTAYGEPVVNEGDVVELIDTEYPERNGSFWVDKVTISAGTGGIRQKIELGTLIS